MRYDEMASLYPQVEELFASVADMIRSGQSSENVLAFLDIRVGSEMRRHRQDVIGKLRQFARVVEENIAFFETWRTDPEPVNPNLCPYCGSLEIESGACRWCVSGKKLKKRRIPMLSEAILRIENQRKKFKQDSNEDGVCQVLLQYCREDPEAARVLASTGKR